VDRYDALDRATAGFTRILSGVTSSQWDLPSINPGWSVHALVNHVVGGNRRYVLLLSGAPTVEVEALRRLEHLGDDPVQDFLDTSADVAAAFREPGVLDRVVHHRLGDRNGADLLVMRVMEHALHGWDLARSIGVDDQIDPEVVDVVLAAMDADPTLLERSGYSPTVQRRDDDPLNRLLRATGRLRPAS